MWRVSGNDGFVFLGGCWFLQFTGQLFIEVGFVMDRIGRSHYEVP